MLSSIHPLGERARGNRWLVTAAWYVAGSVAAGGLVGAALGAIGSPVAGRLPGWAGASVVVASCGAAVLADLLAARRPRLRPPSWRRQVNEDWIGRYRGWLYGLGFGFQLGLGVATIITTFSLFAYLVLAALAGSAAAGALVGTAFGLGRALPLLALAGVHGRDQLRRFHRRLHAAHGPVRGAAATVLTLTALAAVVAR